jgi:hypothetical protein
VLEVLHADEVGVSGAADAQDHDLGAGGHPRADPFEVQVELGRGAEEELPLEIVDDRRLAEGRAGAGARMTPFGSTTSSVPLMRAARGTNSRIERPTPIRIENSTPTKIAVSAVTSTSPASKREARTA